MAKHKLMIVTWIDSAYSSGIYNQNEFEDYACISIKTVGWGYEFDDKVVMAAEYHIRDSGEVDNYRHLFSIPKECIRNIRVLRD